MIIIIYVRIYFNLFVKKAQANIGLAQERRTMVGAARRRAHAERRRDTPTYLT